MSASCESCGAENEALYSVHRQYLTPQTWESEGSERVLEEIERWCFACCTHYPHVPATEAAG